jgi:hypothetical protein
MMIFPARSQTCHCHRVRPRLLSNTSNIAIKALIQLKSWASSRRRIIASRCRCYGTAQVDAPT